MMLQNVMKKSLTKIEKAENKWKSDSRVYI